MLNTAKLRHRLWTRSLVVLMATLCLIEPFLNAHFNAAGWEDEPGLRIQQSGQSLQPELYLQQTDPANETPAVLLQEATLFVPPTLDADPFWGDGLQTASLVVLLVLIGCWQA